jgi:glycosyltransferase involved in cell wall biosynthesis
MRIAFLTPEFVTEYNNGGGLGTYLARMVKLLVARGHEVEVFVTASTHPAIISYEGARVERVPSFWRISRCVHLGLKLFRLRSVRRGLELYLNAWALSRAMEARHSVHRFDIVQSADFLAVGLTVKRRDERVHVVRCSSAADLYNQADGSRGAVERVREVLERLAIRRAERAYAPSFAIANHYGEKHGLSVSVLRPPVAVEQCPSDNLNWNHLGRFFIHFGQLNRRKGTLCLIEALKTVFAAEPTFRIVFVGADCCNVSTFLDTLGAFRSNVVLMQPMEKSSLYSLLRSAEAAVLPSLVDNLPNTVIESLLFGIPVIGTRQSSIDELVEEDITGELVPAGDSGCLAKTILKMWRKMSLVKKGFSWPTARTEEFLPNRAVGTFLSFASKLPNLPHAV